MRRRSYTRLLRPARLAVRRSGGYGPGPGPSAPAESGTYGGGPGRLGPVRLYRLSAGTTPHAVLGRGPRVIARPPPNVNSRCVI